MLRTGRRVSSRDGIYVSDWRSHPSGWSCGPTNRLQGSDEVWPSYTIRHPIVVVNEPLRISGGQYHWVSEFAPASCQKFLSYVAGK